MDRQQFFARAKGALIGCAVGDAMGMPTEMMPWQDIEVLYPDGIRTFYPTSARDFLGRTMRAGEVTDDTINTVLLAEALIAENGVVSAEKYVARLQAWIKANAEKARYVAGPSTLRALQAIEAGTPLEKAGVFGRTNGAAMKMAPLGILCDWQDMTGLAGKVAQICLPTHNTGIAIAGACVVAACISYGVRGGHDLAQLWEIAAAASTEGEKHGFAFPSASLKKRLAMVHEAVCQNDKQTVIGLLKHVYGTSEQTLETVPAALAIVTICGGDAMEACSVSATIGGDTDTIGAIAGAICGSMDPCFPASVIDQLQAVNGIDFDALAQNLATCATL